MTDGTTTTDNSVAGAWSPILDEDEIPERLPDDILLVLPGNVAGDDADLFRSTHDPDPWARVIRDSSHLTTRTRLVAFIVRTYVVEYGFCPGDTEALGIACALPRRRVAESLAILTDAGWITRRFRGA